MQPRMSVTKYHRFLAGARAGRNTAILVLAALAGTGPELHAQANGADDRAALETVIDVAVFYAPTARDALGGAGPTRAEIDLLIAETNKAYRESGVKQRLSLVAVREAQYEFRNVPRDRLLLDGQDLTGMIYRMHLERLVNRRDGFIDEVHTVRDEVGADICVLLVGDYPYSSISAAVQASESQAFVVMGAGSGSRVFAHELGHIQGLRHDRYQDCGIDGACPGGAGAYGYGYVNQRAFEEGATAAARWRTIMAYSTQCDDNGIDCPQLLRFSNPDQVYPDPGGDPMGGPPGARAGRTGERGSQAQRAARGCGEFQARAGGPERFDRRGRQSGDGRNGGSVHGHP